MSPDHNRPQTRPEERITSNKNRAKGLLFVVLTAVIWIVSSFISQFLVRDQDGGQAKLPPLLLTYICTSLFVLYLPLVAAKRRLLGRPKQQPGAAAPGTGDPAASASLSLWLTQQPAAAEDGTQEPLLPAAGDGTPMTGGGLGWWQLACAAALVAPLWYAAQLAFATSLASTSVTSNTILSSSSSLFTFLGSVLVLGERFTLPKAAAVLLVMAGTALVTLSDSRAQGSTHQGLAPDSVLGDLLTVVAAALYAAYTVFMRQLLQHDDSDAMMQFFGLMGAFTSLALAPLLLGAQLLGHIDVTAVTPAALALAVANGLLDYVLSDYFWARAVLLVGPTIATLGLSVQIPLATVLDLFFGQPGWLHHPSTVALTAGGTLAIVLGFVGINVIPSAPARGREEGGVVGSVQHVGAAEEELPAA